jgi:hypothetical protein
VGLKSVAAPALTPASTTHGPWKVGAAFPKQYMLTAAGLSMYTSGRLPCSLYTARLAATAAAVASAGAGHGSFHWRVSPYTVPMQPRMKAPSRQASTVKLFGTRRKATAFTAKIPGGL